jgi:hypothetical protein
MFKKLLRRNYRQDGGNLAHIGLKRNSGSGDPNWIGGESLDFLPSISVPPELSASNYCVGYQDGDWIAYDCNSDTAILVCELIAFRYEHTFLDDRQKKAFI